MYAWINFVQYGYGNPYLAALCCVRIGCINAEYWTG